MSFSSTLSSATERLQSLFRFPSSSASSAAQTYAAAGVSTVLALASLWVVYDKHSWTTFGTGGTPPTWAGYYRANVKFRLRRLLSFDDLRSAAPLKRAPESTAYLDTPLPERKTPRPAVVAWTLPQRQTHYQGGGGAAASAGTGGYEEEMLTRLHGLVERLAAEYGDVLTVDLSNTEGRSIPALYARPGLPGRDPTAVDRVCKDEIAHVHKQEHSLHVFLSEADAAEVVAKGWGERFPLSSLGMVHMGWSFVYAPTTEAEYDVVQRIVKAGVQHLTGKKI